MNIRTMTVTLYNQCRALHNAVPTALMQASGKAGQAAAFLASLLALRARVCGLMYAASCGVADSTALCYEALRSFHRTATAVEVIAVPLEEALHELQTTGNQGTVAIDLTRPRIDD
jgi:hypothetical protein